MKTIVLFFSLLLSGFLFAQQKNVAVEYTVKIHDEEGLSFSNNPSARRLFEQAMANADNLSFSLIITDSGSKFYENSSLSKSGDGVFKMNATLFTGYDSVVFQYFDNLYSASNFIDREIMVKEDLKDNWQLHNETKMIDNYQCYKATNVNRVDNGSGKIFNHPVTAWYCPKLPYSYGPNGYSNLPGLILELQVRNVVYGVKKIDLNSDLDFDPTFLKEVKTISLEELNDKLRKEAESWRE